MSRLAQQQQALLDALFAWPAHAAQQRLMPYVQAGHARGLHAYQSNGHHLAVRALGQAYPVVAQLLGEASFADLACALWHAYPPIRGDLALWGADLAAFAQDNAQLQEVPYVPDVARLEWALHTCAGAPDGTGDPATFALLMREDPAQVQLCLAPGCQVVRSAWPVVSIWQAPEQPCMSAAHDALVWRAGWRPQLRLLETQETAFVQALLAGHSLAQALDAAVGLDFASWLPAAVQSGLVVGARQLLYCGGADLPQLAGA